ncbi:MAG: hypothetical protein ACYS8W_13805 [Planctomycetota bacterium]|jgi:hypothetical protein
MRKNIYILPVLTIACFLAAGCSDDDPTDEPTNPAEMVGDYLVDRVSKKQQAESDLAATRIRQKIKLFWSTNARYPESLSELEEKSGPLPKPARGHVFLYDPASGKVHIVKRRQK